MRAASSTSLVFMLALALAACGGGGEEEGARSGPAPAETTPPTPTVKRPTTKAPQATAALLAGEWARKSTAVLLRLGADGAFAMTLHGDLDDAPIGGRYTVSGGTVTFTNARAGGPCEPNETWVWNARVDGDDLRVDWLQGGCGVAAGERWFFTRRLALDD